MNRILVLCSFCFLLLQARAQKGFIFPQVDTITFAYRVGGKIDSMDLYNCYHLSNLPGGGFNLRNNIFTSQQFALQPNLLNFREEARPIPLKTSALPHLGFTYSFGTKANQFFGVDYQQAFGANTLLNVRIRRNSGTGYVRNSAFKNNEVQLDLRHHGKFYSMVLDGRYGNHTIGESNGVTSDSVIRTFGIIFAPVRSENAQSKIQQGHIELTNYFNFLRDSLQAFGLYTKHRYEVVNRVYTEQDTLAGLYSQINIDSLSTRDQYQTASIRNGAGIYLARKYWSLEGGVDYRYWDYQNLGSHRDTSEVDLSGRLRIHAGKFFLEDELRFNIVGAGNQFRNEARASYKPGGRFSAGAHFRLESLWPEPFQRFYYANNFAYQLPSYQLQKRMYLSVNGTYELKNDQRVSVSLSTLNMLDNYFFINDRWRNDTLNAVSVTSLSVQGSFHYRFIYLQPNVLFNIANTDFDFVPDLDLRARVFLKGKLFKDKKLEGILGADVSYTSGYRLLTYLGPLDVYQPLNSGQSFIAQPNFSVFTGFAIDVFRLYVRLENIAYLFNDATNKVAVGYPIYSGALRIGLTWDFFN